LKVFSGRIFFKIVGIILLNAIGSIAVGIGMALIGALTLKLTIKWGQPPTPAWQIIFTSLLGFFAYSVADLGLSGILPDS
jgi:NhaP-type Na+/H+ or K+/H+ antiporter